MGVLAWEVKSRASASVAAIRTERFYPCMTFVARMERQRCRAGLDKSRTDDDAVLEEFERRHFFRPLSGKHREVIVACVRALYERLHGPSADYAQNLSRDRTRRTPFAIAPTRPRSCV